MDDPDDKGLCEYLSKRGLTHIKWLKRFKDEKITKVDQIEELESKEEKYLALSLDATPVETAALREIFSIKAPTDSPAVGLDRELNEVGLDVSYWSNIFEKHLSIKSPEALQHVGEESYQILAQFVNKPWERRALRKLVKMENEGSSFQKLREKQKQKLKSRQAESVQLLHDIKICQQEGKGRHDAFIQEREQRMRERLQIPSDVWVQDDADLSQMIEQMEAVQGGTLKSRNDVNDHTVIEKASGGLALRGVFFTKDPNDATKLRNNILKLPEGISFDGPSHSQHERTLRFSSKKKEDEFSKRFENLGYSVAASAQAGFSGISFEASAEYSQSKEEEKTKEHHREEMYCSTVKYCVMPMASCSFRDHQLQLSEDALSHLKKINKVLLTNATKSIQVECEGFFDKFGSHAYIGPLHFGGTYTWKSYSSGFTESEKSTVQELQSEAITVQVGVSYGGIAGVSTSGSVANMKGKFSGNYSQDLTFKTEVQFTKIGGPPEVTSLPDWKNGLVGCNATWALIDRGTENIPIWEIIEMNHSSSFPNCNFFLKRLKQTWKNLSETVISQPLVLTTEFKDMMEGVTHWNKTPDPTQYKTQLNVLVAQKERVARQLLNPQVWATQYLSQQPLQQFLQSVVDFCLKESSEDSSSLKRCLRQLLDPIDLDAARVFPNQQSIIEWLYDTKRSIPTVECQDFLTLNSIFKLALEYMQSGILPHGRKRLETVPPPDCSIRATKAVAKAVLNLRRYLKKSGQKYEDMFVTTMLYPFKYHMTKHTFEVLMGLSDLKCLCEKFETEAKQFFIIQKKSVLSLQAYLFLLAVSLYDELDVNETHVKKYTIYLEGKMSDEIKPELAKVLTDLRLNDPEYDWEWFKGELDPLVQGTPIKSGAGDPLLDVLAKEVDNVEHIPHTVENPDIPLDKNEEMKQFFMKLNLKDKFPQKISLPHALEIREDTLEVSSEVDTDNTDGAQMQALCCNNPQIYPFLILQKIMAFDHRCRIKLVLQNERERSSNEESDSDDDDDDDDSIEGMIHPMDGLLALLHCADSILRQDLLNRLAICQIAIPLLLPDPLTHEPTFLLWGMRSIIKEFRNYDSTASYAGPIVHYPAPIVSFLRFGNHSISKSQILNAVISAGKHDTFFHYNCAGGRARKVLLNGVVEVGWYLPSKNDNCFPNAVTFLNLRGNAREHLKQVQFLSKVSSMHFVFLREDDLAESTLSVLNQLSKAPEGIVVLQTQSSPTFKQRIKQSIPDGKFSIIRLFSKNEDDMKVSIQKKIKTRLIVTHTLEECRDVAYDCGIIIDEDRLSCTRAKELAQMFVTFIQDFKKSHPGESPKNLLVLQSKMLWHKYGERDKEQYRQTGKGQLSMYEYAGLQEEKMKQIRRKQFEYSQKLSPLMASFINSLLTNQGEIIWYYLHWLKIYLDDLSRELLPPLHSEYQKKRKELNDIQMQEKKDEIAEKVCRSHMNELNMQLIDASFGPEHVFREVGQLYESVMSQSDAPAILRNRISRLPEIAARLLVDGFPLELMDGDAAHVPIMWVSSVLDKLSTIINQRKTGTSNPQVFVLSVLGLQSTGKSTLMNTLFGVQFSVSAGRCTRGAFMQLLPVHSSLQKICKYQYFLIIDTEGLRAPELDALKMQKHDNELATFVIGIANLTIINIKGEISGDMDDVLQTAVHAFLRMNEVKLTPSCHFVYQNVPAVTAGEKAMQGRFKIKDKLDAMTKEAAEQAGLAHFRYFSEVISFDYENDVSFFPGLWTGSPPMAHVSEFYSIEAQTLKHCIIKRMERSRDNSVQQLTEHLKALWKAILQENFVFSFKNTFEIAAYTKLEEEYGEWSRSFKKAMEKWEQTARSELTSCLVDNLQMEYQAKKSELSEHVNTLYRELKAKMDTHFEESPEQETIAKWKSITEDDLKHLKVKLERHAESTCDKVFISRNSRAKADSKIETLRSDIMENVQRVASGLERGSLTEAELKHKFEECWVGWITELTPHIDRIIPPNIKTEVENSIREHPTLKTHHKILHQKLTQHDGRTGKPKQWGLHLHLAIKKKHLNLSGWKNKFWSYVSPKSVDDFLHPAQEKTAIVFTEVRKWLTKKQNSKEDFKPVYTTEVLEILFFNIKENPSDQYAFSPEYMVEMALTACGYAQRVFEEMSAAFYKEHDPLLYIETELREQCWKLFKDNYEEIAKEKTAAETLCTQLKNPVRMHILQQLAGDVTDRMQKEYKWLKTKKRLRAKVLHDIGERLEADRKSHGGACSNFSECTLYCKNPKQSLEYWIKEYAMKYCDDGVPTRISKIALETLLLTIQSVKKSANDVTVLLSSSSQAHGDCFIDDWLSEFHSRLIGMLTLDLSKLRVFGKDTKLTSVTFFKDEVVKGLEKLQIELTDEFKTMTASVWDDHQLEIKPYDTLFEDLAGCTEQCPFCKEQCEYTNTTHPDSIKHSVIHRPQCLGGYRCAWDNTMVLDVCTFLVASTTLFSNDETNHEYHPYSEYRRWYPKWDIPKERSLQASAFWIWLVGNFSKNIEDCFGYSTTNVHSHWKSKEWAEVKQVLEEEFNA